MTFPAHIRQNGAEQAVQTVEQHSRATAAYAAQRLEAVGLPSLGYLAGLLHDMGKAKAEFEEYLRKAAEHCETVRRGSVNHTFAGCRFSLEQFHREDETGMRQLTSELLAYGIGAHHGQFDCIDSRHRSGFAHRRSKEGIGYAEALQNYRAQVAGMEELERLFAQAKEELVPICGRINALLENSGDVDGDGLFYYGLLARVILSALMDADRTDTAEFMNGCAYPKQPDGEARRAMWQRCLAYMEQRLDEFPKDTPIRNARWKISDACAAAAQKRSGVLRLNVPTGGGKTLSALRYALVHAERWNKSRIVLTSSLLSVLDQNAAVIRAFLPDDVQILEHHSNVVRPKEDDATEWEMLTERYSAPIIITTLVQLLQTLFSGKSACVRRLQALSDSVIVIDEVQTVPDRLLTLFNLAVNFLSEVCNATVVLCSATQPALEYAAHPLAGVPTEMVAYDAALWEPFRRTRIRDAGALRLEEIPQLVRQTTETSLLLICNMKSEARYLYEALAEDTPELFHLSAGMCMCHRRETLRKIQAALDAGRKVVCISTQVIEAGVDISFGCVIRFTAGLDSIVQAAGRCNRNGESEQAAPVYIVRCLDENLSCLTDIQRGKDATEALLDAYARHPERFDNDLSSEAAISYYYRTLYAGTKEKFQDDYISSIGCTLFELLSTNDTYLQGASSDYLLNQAFQTAGAVFTVFDQETTDVLVPYGKGREIGDRLLVLDRQYAVDPKALEPLLQEAKAYTVSLYRFQFEQLRRSDGVMELFNGRICVMTDGFYNDAVGFSLRQKNLWEV